MDGFLDNLAICSYPFMLISDYSFLMLYYHVAAFE